LNKRTLLRLAVAIAFVFCAMTAAWSFGGYLRERTALNLAAGVGFTALTLVLAWYLKRLARRR
jgi:hypothetical protein